jgi:hypothetical protein
MKLAKLRFHFGGKCLAIRHPLLTEFFPPIESARQESNRAHGFLVLVIGEQPQGFFLRVQSH